MLEARWMAVALVLAGCTSGKLGQVPKEGGPDASVGTVTFQVDIPATVSFCDQFSTCSGAPAHVSITDSAGQVYNQTAPSICWCQENTCERSCLAIYCGSAGQGVAV